MFEPLKSGGARCSMPAPTIHREGEGRGKGLGRGPVVRLGIALALFLCLLAMSLGCKQRMAGGRSGASLPSGEWRGWKPEQRIMEYGKDDLREYLSGAASCYLGYSLRRLWVRPYHNPAGHTLTAELYDLTSGEEAYGVLSWDWTGEALGIPGAEAFYTQGALKLRKGRYYLWLLSSTQDDRYREDLIALAKEITQQLPGGLPVPSLVQKLPQEGLRKETIFYFHTKSSLDRKVPLKRENLLQLSRKTNGALASYRLPEGRADFLLVEYPEESASVAFSSFREGYFRRVTAAEESSGLFIAETKSGVYEGMVQSGRLLAVVLNGEKMEVCQHLLGAIKDRTR